MLMYLSTEFTYRWQIFTWVVADLLSPIVLIVLWSSVAGRGSSDVSIAQVVTYFFFVILVSKVTRDWSIYYVTGIIVNGEFSKYLLKPFNYLSEMLGVSIASKLMRLIIAVPMIVIGYFILKKYLIVDLSLENVFLFVFTLFIGFVMNFLLGNIFALLAFFLKQILGLRAFYENITAFLSGEVIPLFFIPVWAIFWIELLPFRYVLSFPIEIIMGSLNYAEIMNGAIISLIWVTLLFVIYRYLYRSAIKKYEAEGI